MHRRPELAPLFVDGPLSIVDVRVARGGSFVGNVSGVRAAALVQSDTDVGNFVVAFRVVVSRFSPRICFL